MADASPAADPLTLLRDLEARAVDAARALSDSTEARQSWRGIGFGLSGRKLVVAMNDVREVLHVPRLARVPGTKSWLLGLSSLRGELLPVVDLNDFLGRGAAAVTRDARVLVVKEDGVLAGLLVEEVFGLQHFAAAEPSALDDGGSDWVAAFAAGRFQTEQDDWTVFDVRALLTASEFLQAAA